MVPSRDVKISNPELIIEPAPDQRKSYAAHFLSEQP